MWAKTVTKHRLKIDRLGGLGDGVATLSGKSVFIPFTLPGELVEISGDPPRFDLEKVIEPSENRMTPICQHFGQCGGCSLQHIEHAANLEWKRAQILEAFNYCGLEVELAPYVEADPESRRRATFSFRNTLDATIFGYLSRRSHTIIDIDECPVLVPEITEKLSSLKRLSGLIPDLSDVARISVLATENGLDVCLLDIGKISDQTRQNLVSVAIEIPLARLALADEILVETIAPTLTTGNIQVIPAPGGFCQPVQTTQQVMVDLVRGHLKKCKSIVDLFSGFGTFALPLAERSKVHAVENQANALDALSAAASGTPGLKLISTEQRDLFRRPLLADELDRFAGVVIDPPRAGAERQTAELVKSSISRIVAISCNPTTLASDIKTLTEGGFKLTKLVPVDQFLFSHHIELVALLERPAAKKKRSIFG